MGQLTGHTRDAAGNDVTNAQIYIYLTGTSTLASLFSDAALTLGVANPVPVDSKGQFVVFSVDGVYDFSVVRSGEPTQSIIGVTSITPSKYPLLAGRAGGTTLKGGTAAGEMLIFCGTAHATPGTVRIDDSHFVFNEAGADRDARFQGGTKPNLWFLDASTDRIGIFTNAPGVAFDIAEAGLTGTAKGWRVADLTSGHALQGFIDASTGFAYVGTLGATGFSLRVNNVDRFYFDSAGGTVWNEAGASVDWRMEGDTLVNLFFLDGSADMIGLGETTTPTSLLHGLRTNDAETSFLVHNSNAAGTGAYGAVMAKGSTAHVSMLGHGSARTVARCGITLGGWTEILATAGSGLLVDVTGANPFVIGTNNVERARFDGNGLLLVPGMHNVTGNTTTSQTVTSGTYTPTLTNVANVGASTMYAAQWMRVGKVVTVSGKADIDPTATVITQFRLSLPVAANFSALEQCGGTGAQVFGGGVIPVWTIQADVANDAAYCEFVPQDTNNRPCCFHFTYLIP